MDSQEVIRNAVRSAGRLARRVEASARASEAASEAEITAADDARALASEAAADARVYLRIVEQLLWVPIVRGRAIAKAKRDLGKAREDGKMAAAKGRAARSLVAQSSEAAAKAAVLAVRLGRALKAVGELGQPPLAAEQASDALRSRTDYLYGRSTNGRWTTDALASCEAMVEVVRDWAKMRMEANERRRIPAVHVEPVAAPALVAARRPAPRVYLPIPAHLGAEAERRGARRDDSQLRGVSPWSVSLDQDLAPFRSMLPLAYRQQPTKFEFPPIPMRAAGQNLWSLFEKGNWDHIRASSYGSSGRRCMVCGGRGGFIADKLMEAEDRRHGVDCHEIWDWTVQDPSTGVGVQKLQKLLVVCVSCHATFHSGHFRRLAAEKGLEAEVLNHIERRRMLINRVGAAELGAELDATREKMGRMTGVDKWIVDLEHLAGQQFMVGQDVTMIERNGAQLPADRIAGIAFETEAGEFHPARTAAEIYADIVAGADYDNTNVVRLSR